MHKITLGDVAKEFKDTYKGSKLGMPVVGLEHLAPQEMKLTSWDDNKDNTFTKTFRKGHVLFGRRRAYLRKAAVAPFDGICSGDITVIEAIPSKIVPELLPFIIQNDIFFDFAVGKSAGSLSPRVKWEHLKEYEFMLPSIEAQKNLSEILWAFQDTKERYKKLLTATDELVKSQFIEMFGNVFHEELKWDKKHFEEVFNDETRYGTKILAEDYLDSGTYPIIDQGQSYIGGYSNNRVGIYENLPAIVFGDHTRILKYVDKPFFLGADGVKLLKSNLNDVNHLFLYSQLQLAPIANTGYNRHYKHLKILNIILPPIELQNQFAAFVVQLDKSKFALLQNIENLEQCRNALMQKSFG